MKEFKNEFGWSKSRDGIFKECLRKYYFNHYGFWGGWDKNAPKKVRELYILKNIISKEIWIGQVVHDVIEGVLSRLKSGDEISLSHALSILRNRLNKDFNESKSKAYKERPKWAAGLFEHEYELLIPKEEWNKLFEKAEKCITNFYNSDTFQYIKKIDPKNWLFLEDFSSFDFEGTNIYIRIDFAIKDNNKIIIFDWKTGRERFEEMDVQLCCYALYTAKKYDIDPEKIIVKKYNLSIDKEDSFKIDIKVIEKIKDYMRKSIKSMKEVLIDKENNIAKEEDFPKTNIEKNCRGCNFKKICKNDDISKGGGE